MESSKSKPPVSIVPLGVITIGGLAIIIFFSAILGFGFELGSQLAWFIADSIKSVFKLPLG